MIVTFRSSAFNTSTREKYFVTARPYGSDVANWLLNELNSREPRAEASIGQRNNGWSIRFSSGGAKHQFVIVYRTPHWVGSLERAPRMVDRFLRRRPRPVESEAVLLINSILSSSELVDDVRWQAAVFPNTDLPRLPD
jgi:hypothetical protein